MRFSELGVGQNFRMKKVPGAFRKRGKRTFESAKCGLLPHLGVMWMENDEEVEVIDEVQ